MRGYVRRTGRVTARPRTDDNQIGRSVRAAIAALTLLNFLLILVFPTTVLAADDDIVLPGSGIHYPGGFDLNTVGDMRGKAYGIHVPESGPVRFQVATVREIFTVLASPPWYWQDLKGNAIEGKEIQVRGSKSLGKDGNLYIIALEVKIIESGRILAFRDEDGFPLWRGGTHRGGARGGFGSPMRGEGIGHGVGAGGRGRR